MKIRKLRYILLAGLVAIGMISLLIGYLSLLKGQPLKTYDIRDYGSEQYPLVSVIFMDQLPKHADICSFSYYNDNYQLVDIYLELKFSSLDEMNHYLNDLKENGRESLDKYRAPENGTWFITQENIYDKSYMDLFCSFFHTAQKDKNYTGYSVNASNESNATISCNFAVISYSVDELIVIQSYSYGTFLAGVHDYIPGYFARFDVPLNENIERCIYWGQGDGSVVP